MATFFQKIKIFIKSIIVFRNWGVYPLSYYKLFPNSFIIFKTRTKKILKIRKKSTDLMALTNVWLFEEYKKTGFEIKPNDTIIDIGAHIGLFSVYASQYCSDGKIFSFEPIKENYELLDNNIKLNSLKNIKIFNFAVSGNSNPIKLFINQDEAAHSMLFESSKSIIVNSISLQKLFDENKIEFCDLLKLDCEGAEYEIIKNLPSEYFKKIDKIIMEYHMSNIHSKLFTEIKEILSYQKFKIEIRSSDLGMGFIYAKKS